MESPERVPLGRRYRWRHEIDDAPQPDDLRRHIEPFGQQQREHQGRQADQNLALAPQGRQQRNAQRQLNLLPGLEIPAILLGNVIAQKCSGLAMTQFLDLHAGAAGLRQQLVHGAEVMRRHHDHEQAPGDPCSEQCATEVLNLHVRKEILPHCTRTPGLYPRISLIFRAW
ncbi:MAG: hypothetical protein DMG58_26905 [Acidobacteria bacterium]|nr:MAG: hypothetical protein DMG58_26905 [Acidobacteriota bacterium]